MNISTTITRDDWAYSDDARCFGWHPLRKAVRRTMREVCPAVSTDVLKDGVRFQSPVAYGRTDPETGGTSYYYEKYAKAHFTGGMADLVSRFHFAFWSDFTDPARKTQLAKRCVERWLLRRAYRGATIGFDLEVPEWALISEEDWLCEEVKKTPEYIEAMIGGRLDSQLITLSIS